MRYPSGLSAEESFFLPQKKFTFNFKNLFLLHIASPSFPEFGPCFSRRADASLFGSQLQFSSEHLLSLCFLSVEDEFSLFPYHDVCQPENEDALFFLVLALLGADAWGRRCRSSRTKTARVFPRCLETGLQT